MKTFSYLVEHLRIQGQEHKGPPWRYDIQYKWQTLAHEEDVEINQIETYPRVDETNVTDMELYLISRGNQGWELVQIRETSKEVHTFIFKRDFQGYIGVMQPHWDKEAYEEARMEAETFEMPPMFPHDDD